MSRNSSGPARPLVATKSDADDAVARLSQFKRFIQNSLCGIDPEMAHGVEDPIERYAEIALAALAATLQAFKQRSKLASAPMNHANRDIHFCMNHVLRM